jgi:hypothetical protein
MSDQEDCLSLAKIQAEVARLRSEGFYPDAIAIDYVDFSRASAGQKLVMRLLPTTRKSTFLTFDNIQQMEGRARRAHSCPICDMEARGVILYKKEKPPERHDIDWCKEGF